jgi:hypothetical protein
MSKRKWILSSGFFEIGSKSANRSRAAMSYDSLFHPKFHLASPVLVTLGDGRQYEIAGFDLP